MKILDNIVREIRRDSGLKQYTDTGEVINWFQGLNKKNKLKFVIFDVENFYPSITPKLLNKSLKWAGKFVNLTQQQTKIIHQASQSFLYHEGQPWVKKGNVNFDIGMGAYHGAQACEIVGLYMLNLLKDLPNFETILYRDDGLGVTPSTPRLQEKLRQNIIKIFAEQELKITIITNQTRVDYLNITMDLETGLYQPYRKPGDKPQYVSAMSNHPPQVIKNIPMGIERRLSDTSANQQIFKKATPTSKLN